MNIIQIAQDMNKWYKSCSSGVDAGQMSFFRKEN
jgi:hypothetical protein